MLLFHMHLVYNITHKMRDNFAGVCHTLGEATTYYTWQVLATTSYQLWTINLYMRQWIMKLPMYLTNEIIWNYTFQVLMHPW